VCACNCHAIDWKPVKSWLLAVKMGWRVRTIGRFSALHLHPFMLCTKERG
jgi:hypothetical protein